ncbi:MAG TPA: radical SAM protein [Candidatus Ozemobacteraceae bacterium]
MRGKRAPRRVVLLEPSVAAECVVTELTGQIRCGAPFLAGALVEAGFEAEVIAEELTVFDARLMDEICRSADVVGLSLALNTLPRGLHVAQALKRRRPDLPVVAGGPSASAFADKLLTACDAVFRGRAETSLPVALRRSEGTRFPADVPGIVVPGPDGPRHDPRDPLPADGPTRYDLVRDLGPWTARDGMFGGPKEGIYTLFASTGCVRSCRFCQSPKRWIPRSLDNVIADLGMILRVNGPSRPVRIMLADDCLFADIAWTKELLRRLVHAVRTAGDVRFSLQFHVAPTADDELMRLFKEARVSSLALGLESVSAETLDSQRKGTTPEQNAAAIDQCRRFDIVPYGYFVTGFDTDSEETVRSVFSYIRKQGIIAQVLPVGLMSRDPFGRPTPEAPRVLSDTSFGATVFVSHLPRTMPAWRLQELINSGHDTIMTIGRMGRFSTSYERAFLFGQARCLAVWRPAMAAHVERLRGLDPRPA